MKRPKKTVIEKFVMYQMHSPAIVWPRAKTTAKTMLTKCCMPPEKHCFDVSMAQTVQVRFGDSRQRLYQSVASTANPRNAWTSIAKWPETTWHSLSDPCTGMLGMVTESAP